MSSSIRPSIRLRPIEAMVEIEEESAPLSVIRFNTRFRHWTFTGPGLLNDPLTKRYAEKYFVLETSVTVKVSNKIVLETSKAPYFMYVGLLWSPKALAKCDVILALRHCGLYQDHVDIEGLYINKAEFVHFVVSERFVVHPFEFFNYDCGFTFIGPPIDWPSNSKILRWIMNL